MPKLCRPLSSYASQISFIGLAFTLVFVSGCSGLHLPNAGNLPGAPQASHSSTIADAGAVKKAMNAGNIAAKGKQWESAIAHFNDALRSNPDYAPAHVQLGWAYAEQKKWEEAKTHLLKAVTLSPGEAGAHANLAWVNAEQGRWSEAQSEAGKAIDLDGKNPYAHATLAWAYQKTNQDELAIAEYEKSLELKPDLTNSRFALGMAYCNTGAAPRAKEQLAWLQSHHTGEASTLKNRVEKGCYPPKK
jgi:tetratricopeptide (TPR) repeat protein